MGTHVVRKVLFLTAGATAQCTLELVVLAVPFEVCKQVTLMFELLFTTWCTT